MNELDPLSGSRRRLSGIEGFFIETMTGSVELEGHKMSASKRFWSGWQSLATGLIALLLVGVACEGVLQDEPEALSASGVVEAVEFAIAPELGGRVAEVPVDEGESVAAGQVVLRLEGEMLQAQEAQARAGLEAARAGRDSAQDAVQMAAAELVLAEAQVQVAEAGVEAAEIQYRQALKAARLEGRPIRTTAWEAGQPDEFDLPGWYFLREDELEALEAEVAAAREAWETELERYQALLDEIGNPDLDLAEERLIEAQTSYQVAEDLLARAEQAQGNEVLEEQAQELFDAAENELAAAQSAYDQLLTSQRREEVLEARARLSAARERYEIALDRRDALLVGADDLTVEAAEVAVREAEAQLASARARVRQAEARVAQAESGLVQAEAALGQAAASLETVLLQLQKLQVHAPVSGVVLTRVVQPGEVVQPGALALTLGDLDMLTVTVYLPEDRYGEVELGDRATVTADSFPGVRFEAEVKRIADQAEYTPRNVQTEEERRTTVYAVELALLDPEGRLKPGMPVDVRFDS